MEEVVLSLLFLSLCKFCTSLPTDLKSDAKLETSVGGKNSSRLVLLVVCVVLFHVGALVSLHCSL